MPKVRLRHGKCLGIWWRIQSRANRSPCEEEICRDFLAQYQESGSLWRI
jgi:hypothetical protein